MKRTIYSAIILIGLIGQSGQAQIVPDDSLGSIVVPVQVGREDIIGGTAQGENLFHSFESFDVGEGAEAYFVSPNGISRIFSRVTGSDISEVLGKLGTSGASTDLFFLNSNGILFGPNSSLDINGSLILSTADSIEFPNGRFNSTLGVNPYLSPETPIGLNLSTSGLIRIENRGSVPSPPLPPSVLVSAPIQLSSGPGLSLSPQNTLALVANEIDLNGAIIRAMDGRVVLAGLSGQASIFSDELGWKLEPEDISEFGNIRIRNGGRVEAVGTLSGQINAIAQDINLINGGTLISANYGGSNFSGGIELVADNLTIGDGALPPGLINDDLISQSINGGRGGDILLSVNNLRIAAGGQVLSTATDSSSGGDIQIYATNSIVLDGTDPIIVPLSSAINNVTYGSGNSGDISVNTDYLQILDGGIVSSSTTGSGDAGDVTIMSNDIEIRGFMPFVLRPSFAGSITTGTGNSGELDLRTQTLEISGGGAAGTSSLGSSGDAGDTFIQASESIQVVGRVDPALSGTPSSIVSNSSLIPETVQEASEIDGALLGRSGSLYIDTPILSLRDGGFIGVQNDGTLSNAGSILINTEELRVLNASRIAASTAGGQGGNIQIFSESVLIADRSSIDAAAAGEGGGGNILVNSQVIGAFRDSKISANAERGQGGNITLNSIGLFQDDSSTITATSARGPQFNGVVNIQYPDPSLEESSVLPRTGVGQYPDLPLGCNTDALTQQDALIITGRGGIPESARGPLRSYGGWISMPSQEASSISETVLVDSISLQAQGWKANSDGTYSMVTEDYSLRSSTVDSSENCVSDISR